MKTIKEDPVYTSYGWITIYWVITSDDNNYLLDKKPFFSLNEAQEYMNLPAK